MRNLILALSMLLTIGAMGQNGGQTNEDCAAKFTMTSRVGTTLYVSIQNKSACSRSYSVGFGSYDTVVLVPANDTKSFHVLNYTYAKIQAKPLSVSCPANTTSCNGGQLESPVIDVASLPVKWVQQPKAVLKDQNTLDVTFTLSEITQVTRIRVQFSDNGRDWRDAWMTLSPEQQIPLNVPYTVRIDLRKAPKN